MKRKVLFRRSPYKPDTPMYSVEIFNAKSNKLIDEVCAEGFFNILGYHLTEERKDYSLEITSKLLDIDLQFTGESLNIGFIGNAQSKLFEKYPGMISSKVWLLIPYTYTDRPNRSFDIYNLADPTNRTEILKAKSLTPLTGIKWKLTDDGILPTLFIHAEFKIAELTDEK